MTRWLRLLLALALAMTPLAARADEKLAGIACRSVHLAYPAPAGVAFCNEVSVDRSAPGTYVMACGWDKGYFGIQEQGGGKKVALFSVWDSPQNDPKAVAQGRRVEVVHKDEKVRIGRFGGEGTGGQAFLDLDWKVGRVYRFLVTARADGDRTEYAGYLRGPDDAGWTHMVTFSTVTGGVATLRGYYSFVEDFRRDRVSATRPREAHFGGGWIEAADGRWTPLTRARFTADRNPVTNIDARVDGERFVLVTGGETKNEHTKLNEVMSLPAKDGRTPPEGLPGAGGTR